MSKVTGDTGRGVTLLPGGGQENWDDWHVPARGVRGFYANQQCKVPVPLRAALQQIADSKIFPYKSIGYIVRHALVRHVRWLRSHEKFNDPDGKIGSVVATMEAMNEIVRNEEYMEDFSAVFENLERQVKKHKERRNPDRARLIVTRAWAKIKQINDDFWRGEMEEEMKQRFGDLLKKGKGK